MDEDLTPLINAFENFKFNLHDLVKHRSTQGAYGLRSVVISRMLVHTGAGFEKRYVVSSVNSLEGLHLNHFDEGEIEYALTEDERVDDAKKLMGIK